jgi:hypothetical protein
MAWHPPIFLNSAGQFPLPVPTYDSPVPPAYGLFGIAKMPAAFAANARPIGGGGGLFDSLARLPAANTDSPPSIFGAIARPPYAAPMPASNPSLSASYRPYLADPLSPPDPTLLAWLPQSPGPTAAGASPLGPWNGVSIASAQGPETAAPPTRSVLFNHAPAAWDPVAPDRNAANLDQTARTLGLSDLPLSKSGAPFVSPPPQLSITPQQVLDVAHVVSPNLVDYFTKTPPPPPSLPSTPAKIPSSDNPYALGAAFEAATWLLGGSERGIVGPLESVATAAERRAAEAAFKPGTFSITDWSGYKEFLPRPEGPFRILDREEYDQARSAADRINEKLHRTDPATYEGKHIHEIHPVKFGGSPTDPKNKIALSPEDHYAVNAWWARLQRNVQTGKVTPGKDK